MKIAIFSDSFLPYCSGVTVAVIAQSRELSRRGHDVAIFRPRPPRRFRESDAEVSEGIRVFNVPFSLPAPSLPKLRITIPTFVSSIRRLRRIKPDIIHVNTEWGCGWEGLLAGKLLRVPVVGTFHTFFAEPGYLKSLGLPNWAIVRETMWRYSVAFYNRCDAVTSPSDAVRRSLCDHGVRNNPTVISNGIPTPQLRSDEEIAQLRAEHGIQGPAFVYCGRVSYEKSMDVLIDAFKLVTDQHPEAKLVIIGDGPCSNELASRVQQLGIAGNVVNLGMVPHDKLIEKNLTRLGDVFVTASKTENQPLSVLEAMCFRLPIIGPHAKGLCEMIDHGENGLAFFPDDTAGMAQHMLTLYRDTTLRNTLGRAAQRYAAGHTIDNVVNRLEILYERTIKGLPLTVQGNLDAA